MSSFKDKPRPQKKLFMDIEEPEPVRPKPAKPDLTFDWQDLLIEENAQQKILPYWTTAEIAAATGHAKRTILRHLNLNEDVLFTYKAQSTQQGPRQTVAYTIPGAENPSELIEMIGLLPVTHHAQTILQLAQALDVAIRTMRRYVQEALEQGKVEQVGVVPVKSQLNNRIYRVVGYASATATPIQEVMEEWTQD